SRGRNSRFQFNPELPQDKYKGSGNRGWGRGSEAAAYWRTGIQRKYEVGGLQAAEPLWVAERVLGYNGALQGGGVGGSLPGHLAPGEGEAGTGASCDAAAGAAVGEGATPGVA